MYLFNVKLHVLLRLSDIFKQYKKKKEKNYIFFYLQELFRLQSCKNKVITHGLDLCKVNNKT